MKRKTTIGWQEWISLPVLNVPAIKVKVDTGARTSSIHAENVKYFQKDDKTYIKFDVLPLERDKTTIIHCEAPLLEKRHVKSSNGQKEYRPIILTTLKLGGMEWEIELNLTKRNYMKRHMLLGRNSLVGKVIIDPEKKFLLGDYDKKTAKKLYNK